MSGLWRNNPETKGGKYLVQRRDGSVPEWPFFVIGARDPAAVHALNAYADKAEELGKDAKYVEDVRNLAKDFQAYLDEHGEGDPDGTPHRVDDPETVTKMLPSKGA